ncbi:MAG: type II toxin-antitoxin system VapB family antitoxin [Chloroflexi bacterium]|jgi:antitoxin VapB|nr:type II toxin-antitoxin system VapB family antitoxin [Chloroflexota bacterium]
MSLNIKNVETHRLVKELADETGMSMTAAVTDAVRRRLDEVRAERGRAGIDLDRALALTAEMRERLGADYLATDFDARLYDERGLPR